MRTWTLLASIAAGFAAALAATDARATDGPYVYTCNGYPARWRMRVNRELGQVAGRDADVAA